MKNSKLSSKVRKQLGMPAPRPVYMPKSPTTKTQSQPTKGCCGKGR